LLITDLTVTQEDFTSLEAFHSDPHSVLRWELVFTLPAWLKTWWQNFGAGAELYLRAVRKGDKVIGIAPLQIRDGKACIIGSANVCDYQDFITSPGSERDFFAAILADLKQHDIKTLELESLRPDSCSVAHLVPLAQECNYKIDFKQSDVSLDIDLPHSWEEYLNKLDRKQRHEVRRKIRNLQEAGLTNYRSVEDKNSIPQALDAFLRLFPDYRADKAEFMTLEMQTFFRALTETMAETGIVRFGFLDFGGNVVAMIMYFEYNEGIYLYNSAYDPNYSDLSVGTICKTSCIQDSIQKGKRKFDFLKGSEKYKYYLGGQEIPLYNYTLSLP
jgi:CelD/BcsL family acetyltransferase involved in cellulose biosynthesis